MKRAAVFGMVVLVIASAWTYLAAQSTPTSAPPKAPAPLPGAAPQTFDDARPQSSARFDRDQSSPTTPLQQRYIELATKKSRLMTEEQLQQSVNDLDREVEELHAWARVEESAKILREVIEKHPQSRAAASARAAIRIMEQGHTNAPVPDDRFSPRPTPGPPPADQPFEAAPRPGTEVIPSRAPKV